MKKHIDIVGYQRYLQFNDATWELGKASRSQEIGEYTLTVATICATADTTFDEVYTMSIADRIARVKKAFGLPKWITRNFAPPQRAPLPYAIGDTVRSTPKAIMPPACVGFPAPKTNPKVFVVDPPPTKPSYVSNTIQVEKHAVPDTTPEQNVIARVEVARLSKAPKLTTKDRIFKYVETFGPNGVTMRAICSTFPEMSPDGLRGRISEMVKAGQIILLGQYEDIEGKKVNFYTVPA